MEILLILSPSVLKVNMHLCDHNQFNLELYV